MMNTAPSFETPSGPFQANSISARDKTLRKDDKLDQVNKKFIEKHTRKQTFIAMTEAHAYDSRSTSEFSFSFRRFKFFLFGYWTMDDMNCAKIP